MNDLKEKVLNGFMNTVLFGLPIALVVIFGEEFSLWLNLLTLGCILFLSAVFSFIGDEYESPKRILLALMGATIAANLKVLAYPGHTAMIVLTTIFIVCVYDIINRGQIIWIDFARRSRLHFLEKFILLTTFLFATSLVIANFGSQAIWIPTVTAALLVMLLFAKDHFLDNDDSNREKTIYVMVGALALTGIISTIIQFHGLTILGVEIWKIILVAVILTAFAIFIYIKDKKRKVRTEAEETKRKNDEKQEKAKQEAETERSNREQRLKNAKEKSMLEVEDISFIFTYFKPEGLEMFFEKEINLEDIKNKINISNNKKQITWDYHLWNTLGMMELCSEKNFYDKNLDKIIDIVEKLSENIKSRKKTDEEYEGEKNLIEKLQKIKKTAKVAA